MLLCDCRKLEQVDLDGLDGVLLTLCLLYPLLAGLQLSTMAATLSAQSQW